MEHVKLCKKCNKHKSLEQFEKTFTKDDNTKVYYRNTCKTCRRAAIPVANKLLKEAKYRAKKRNLLFNLTLDDIQIPPLCPVFNTPLVFKGGPDAPSVDRIDNTKGYTKDNIIIVSLKANLFKSYATIDELKQLVKFYAKLISNK